MRRRIVKQGSATMTISLPSSWIKKFNLKGGDEIEIEEKQERLEIFAKNLSEENKAKIKISEDNYFSKNDLSHLYILGYDEISIEFEDNKTLEEIKERISDCIGYEIIEQHENKVLIKCISNELSSEFDNILRKVFLITKEMGQNIYETFEKREFNRLKQIREMESLNNKFTGFLLRLLTKKGYKNFQRTPQAYDLIQNMERIADEYKYLCDNFINHKKSIDKLSLNLLERTNKLYIAFYDMYYDFDNKKKYEFRTKRKSLYDEALNMLKQNKECVLSHHVLMLIEKIYNTAGSFLALNTLSDS